MPEKSTLEQFISDSIKCHGDKYDYSRVVYVNGNTKVSIYCKKHKFWFEQRPSQHKRGAGCIKCSGRERSTTEKFISDSIAKFGDKYDYSKVNYINNQTKVTIICPTHKEFDITPNAHLSQSLTGCPNCSREQQYINQRRTKEEFLEIVTELHGNKYDYSLMNYVDGQTMITIICDVHGPIEIRAQKHLIGVGCRACSEDEYRYTLEQFIELATEKYGDKYDYSLVNYINSYTKITVICKIHGVFQIIPSGFLHNNRECQKCSNRSYSIEQMEWLEFMSYMCDIYIQHATNDGEYQIPGTKLKVDGYCEEINTIFQYHGDFWHGNPELYKSDEIHRVYKKPCKELYDKTIKTENRIKEKGYRLVVIWGKEWKRVKKAMKILKKRYSEILEEESYPEKEYEVENQFISDRQTVFNFAKEYEKMVYYLISIEYIDIENWTDEFNDIVINFIFDNKTWEKACYLW